MPGYTDAVGIFAVATTLKMLLMWSYRSTDFEVHRNWLALTSSLPMEKWYYEATSEWTLDYPPFFAWFEWTMSFAACLFDPEMLVVSNLNHATDATVLFQRLSVMSTDLVLLYGVVMYTSFQYPADTGAGKTKRSVVQCLLLLNTGLTIVDHIHFQYNGFLYGQLIISLALIQRGWCISGGVAFAALLGFKHIYLYIAPAYFVYLFRGYCFPETHERGKQFSFGRFLSLGVAVLATFAVCLGPFAYKGQLEQLASRLFPFKRGLCHAYWAPNVWALYNVGDKALSIVGKRTGAWSVAETAAGMTGGLVTDLQAYAVLPEVSPATTLILSMLSMLPPLWTLWFKPTLPTFVRAVYMCGFGTFLFGWHVHEKAIMLVTVPLCLIATDSKQNARRLLSVSAAGYAALFPLLYEPQETVLKCGLLLAYCAGGYVGLRTCLGGGELGYSWAESAYLAGLIPLQIFVSVVHPVLLAPKLPFLPLMATSVYCGTGLVAIWFADLLTDLGISATSKDSAVGAENSSSSSSSSKGKATASAVRGKSRSSKSKNE